MLVASYLAGSLPLTNVASRRVSGVDLRDVGNGTVSGTGLYSVTGFRILAVVGCMELAKGAAGPLLAGRERPWLAAAAGGAAVTGHNWSPFLGFAGGRGVAPALGASLVTAPEGSALLAAGLGLGRLAGETAIGCFLSICAMPWVLGRRRGAVGWATGLALAVPMLVKRVVGNGPVPSRSAAVYLYRLVLDRDTLRTCRETRVERADGRSNRAPLAWKSIRMRRERPSALSQAPLSRHVLRRV
ncbi:MAG TPA: glycerol-3-phosphate acyltransferase [Acidimicrobiales bacterium]|nr:glycerol-3-phosphate acyltransferase [Acidimicrobiales bacterium]